MADFKIEIDTRAVRALLTRVIRAVDDPSPVMADIAEALASESERQFRTESGPSGGRWPDLAESTKRQRARKGKWPGKMLQVEGDLAASVVAESDRNSATITVGMIYGATHQFGRGPILARPFLPLEDDRLSSDAETTILELLNRHLQQATAGR